MSGTFKKILKGVLIGGGTILSLFAPPAGVGVISAGMAIGSGAVAAGGLIKTDKTPAQTIDKITTKINDKLTGLGLMQPAGSVPGSITIGTPWYVRYWPALAAVGLAILFIFGFKRRR